MKKKTFLMCVKIKTFYLLCTKSKKNSNSRCFHQLFFFYALVLLDWELKSRKFFFYFKCQSLLVEWYLKKTFRNCVKNKKLFLICAKLKKKNQNKNKIMFFAHGFAQKENSCLVVQEGLQKARKCTKSVHSQQLLLTKLVWMVNSVSTGFEGTLLLFWNK